MIARLCCSTVKKPEKTPITARMARTIQKTCKATPRKPSMETLPRKALSGWLVPPAGDCQQGTRRGALLPRLRSGLRAWETGILSQSRGRNMDLQLAGKVIFIAGASRGIGLGIAEACLAEGAKVALTARGADALKET